MDEGSAEMNERTIQLSLYSLKLHLLWNKVWMMEKKYVTFLWRMVISVLPLVLSTVHIHLKKHFSLGYIW